MNKSVKIVMAALLFFGLVGSASAAVYVENLAPNMTSDDVHQVFSQYGKVMDVEFIDSSNTASGTTASVVRMGNMASEMEAISSLNGKRVKGSKLKVRKSNISVQQSNLWVP